jgi:acetolactate synthase-1/2/3 large subunit
MGTNLGLLDGGTSVLLISGFDDQGRGGLFSFDGIEIKEIDHLASTGLAVRDNSIGRLLRASPYEPIAELLVYDDRGITEYRRLDAISDPHDLVCLEDGSWLVVSSKANRVSHVGRDGAISTIWEPSAIPDAWHPNCVAVLDDEIWVTAFGRFDTTREWSGPAGVGAGFLTNLMTGEEFGGLSHPHSPRFLDGSWWVCNSLEATLVRWNGRRAVWEQKVELQDYPRGLAASGDLMFVGESVRRGESQANATLVVLDESAPIQRIPVPCSEIYDIIVAPASMMDGLRRGFSTNPQRLAVDDEGDLLTSVGDRSLLRGIGEPLEPETVKTSIQCEVPEFLTRGVVYPVQVSVINAGECALSTVPPYPVFLSYRWTDATGSQTDGERTALGQPLLQGHSAGFEIDVRVPEEVGEYMLSISLVQEGHLWFDELAASNGYRARIAVGSGKRTATAKIRN